MSSRQTQNSKGQTQYSAPSDNAGAMPQIDIFVSSTGIPSGLQALVGKTIRGQVVGALERWADGGIWDTGNNRFLYAGSDFDPAILNRA